MVACPHCHFIFYEMQDIFPVLAFPPGNIILRGKGQHIGQAAFAAALAGDFIFFSTFHELIMPNCAE